MIKIEINDSELQALFERVRKLSDPKPLLSEIGEYGVRSTKQRFAAGRGPDGKPWAPNTQATILKILGRRSGESVRRPGEKASSPYQRKDGRLNSRGAALVANKRPLIGESKRLSSEINYQLTTGGVEIGSSLEYASVQQFGAKAGSFRARIPWGDIPARPFIGLSDADMEQVKGILRRYLADAIG